MAGRTDDATAVRQRLYRVTAGHTSGQSDVDGLPGLSGAPGGPAAGLDAWGGPGSDAPGGPAAGLDALGEVGAAGSHGPRPTAAHDEPGRLPGGPPAARSLSGLSAFDPGRRGIKALAAVAVLVVLVAAFLAWRARPRPEPVGGGGAEPASRVERGARGGAGAADAAGAPVPGPAGAEPSSGVLVVAVAGKVRRPGLVRLGPGARVADAVAAAGGVLPGTDITLLNLARKVSDGELIVVGVGAPGVGPAAGGQVAGQPAGPAGPPGGAQVNLNTATLAQLDALPGVGPVLAQRILDHRTSRGGFRAVGELRQVDGIGDARFTQLKELVTI